MADPVKKVNRYIYGYPPAKVTITIDNTTKKQCQIYALKGGNYFKKLKNFNLLPKSRVDDSAELTRLSFLYSAVLKLEFVTDDGNCDEFELELKWVAPCYFVFSNRICMENCGNELPLQQTREGIRVDGYVVSKKAQTSTTSTYFVQHESSGDRVLEVLRQDHDLNIFRNLQSEDNRKITIEIRDRDEQFLQSIQNLNNLLQQGKLKELEQELERLLEEEKNMERKQKLTDKLRTTKMKLSGRHFDKARSLEEQRDTQKARDMHLVALQLAEEALSLSKTLSEKMDAENLMTKIKLKMSIIDLLDGSITIHQDFLRKYAEARKNVTENNLKIAAEYCEKTKESYLKVQAEMQKLHEVFPQESHGLGKITDAIEALDLNAIDLNASMLVQAMKNIEGFQVSDEKQESLDRMLREEQKKMEKDRAMELLGLGDDPVEELVDIDE